MRILITGASGFIGGKLLHCLLEKESPENIGVVLRTCSAQSLDLDNVGCHVIETPDLFSESYEWWVRVCSDIDLLIHCAWPMEYDYLESEKNLDAMMGSITMIRGAVSAGVKKIVGLGTCLEYDRDSDYSVGSPLNPFSSYACAKAAVYLFGRQIANRAGVAFTWCRVFGVYGPGEKPNRLFPTLHNNLANRSMVEIKHGQVVRDYSHVDSVVSTLLVFALGESEKSVVNVCSGKGRSVRQIAEAIAEEYDAHDFLRISEKSLPDSIPQTIIGLPGAT